MSNSKEMIVQCVKCGKDTEGSPSRLCKECFAVYGGEPLISKTYKDGCIWTQCKRVLKVEQMDYNDKPHCVLRIEDEGADTAFLIQIEDVPDVIKTMKACLELVQFNPNKTSKTGKENGS